MNTLQDVKRIDKLIEEAQAKTKSLSKDRGSTIQDALERAQASLATPAQKRNHVVLLLSSAIRHMQRAERSAIDGILTKEWLSQQEEALLVRIRLICAEVIGLLTSANDDLRLVPVKAR